MFQSTKTFILLNPQYRIQWANFNRTQATGKASSDSVTGSSSCLHLRVQNPLKKYINASQFRRQFHLFSAHLTQFTSADTFHRFVFEFKILSLFFFFYHKNQQFLRNKKQRKKDFRHMGVQLGTILCRYCAISTAQLSRIYCLKF